MKPGDLVTLVEAGPFTGDLAVITEHVPMDGYNMSVRRLKEPKQITIITEHQAKPVPPEQDPLLA